MVPLAMLWRINWRDVIRAGSPGRGLLLESKHEMMVAQTRVRGKQRLPLVIR